MLRFFAGIRARGMGLRGRCGNRQFVQLRRLTEDSLTERQWRGGFITGVVIRAPQRRGAIELLEHRKNHPRSVVHRGRIAAAVVGQQQFLGLLGARQEAP
ncbi:hypothetical protein D3C85_1678210 [compost metagenome]